MGLLGLESDFPILRGLQKRAVEAWTPFYHLKEWKRQKPDIKRSDYWDSVGSTSEQLWDCSNDEMCRGCHEEEETPLHVLCMCSALDIVIQNRASFEKSIWASAEDQNWCYRLSPSFKGSGNKWSNLASLRSSRIYIVSLISGFGHMAGTIGT